MESNIRLLFCQDRQDKQEKPLEQNVKSESSENDNATDDVNVGDDDEDLLCVIDQAFKANSLPSFLFTPLQLVGRGGLFAWGLDPLHADKSTL